MDRRLADNLSRSAFLPINHARSASYGIRDDGAGSVPAANSGADVRSVGGDLQEAVGLHLSLLAELVSAEGWSDARAIANSLICRFAGLVYPRLADTTFTRDQLSESSAILEIFSRYFPSKNVERLVVGYTDATERLLAIEVVASGSIEAVCAEARRLFSSALCLDARGIILAHNHPSGDPTPSDADMRATQHVKFLAEQLGMELIDHLIFAGGRPYSIRKGAML